MAAVIGVRGGVGASTMATSLAWLLGEKARRTTALLDLDVHFGTGALALDLEPGRGLTDAIENPSRIDGLFIERAMVRANERLSVLSAEAPIHQPLVTDGSAFFQLQEEMRNAFESTVLDLPRHMLIQHPHLVHDAHVAVVVAELTLAATRDTIRVLAWLKSNAPQTKVIVVANGVPSGGALEISRKDFEQSIERPVDIVFPYDAKLAAQAAKLGKPMAEVASGKMAAPFNTLSNMVLSHASDEGAGARPRRRRGEVAGRQSEVDAFEAEGQGGGVSDRVRRPSPRPQELRGEGTNALWLLLIGGVGALGLAFMAMRGPSAAQSAQAPHGAHQGAPRRRHRRQRPGADPQAFRRAASKMEGYASTLIPKPALLRKRLEMTGKDITLGKYADDLPRHRRVRHASC